jgi:flavodoxin
MKGIYMKTLIVFFSLTGNTRKIAQAISEELNGTLEEIQDTRNRNGIAGYLLSIMEAIFKKRSKIQEVKHDPSAYDLVIIGTPVWAFNISSPVRTYLEQKKNSINEAAFFVTCTASGGKKVLQDMTNLYGKKASALLEIKEEDIKSGKYLEKVKQFIH